MTNNIDHAANNLANHTIVLDLSCRGIIGVYDFERTRRKKLAITLEFTLLESQLLSLDLISNIETLITHSVNNDHPRLLEKMAYSLANTIFDSLSTIKALTLTIRKPSALTHAACAYVTVSLCKPKNERHIAAI